MINERRSTGFGDSFFFALTGLDGDKVQVSNIVKPISTFSYFECFKFWDYKVKLGTEIFHLLLTL